MEGAGGETGPRYIKNLKRCRALAVRPAPCRLSWRAPLRCRRRRARYHRARASGRVGCGDGLGARGQVVAAGERCRIRGRRHVMRMAAGCRSCPVVPRHWRRRGSAPTPLRVVMPAARVMRGSGRSRAAVPAPSPLRLQGIRRVRRTTATRRPSLRPPRRSPRALDRSGTSHHRNLNRRRRLARSTLAS